MLNPLHRKYLNACLTLAKKGEGKVALNPMVGAILTHKGKIIGKGYHTAFGKPHAEIEAINDALKRGHANFLKYATLYINLEPCCHYGKTPPCTDTIIASKIRNVVIAMKDPNPKVSGNGIKKLEKAGIKVELLELPEAKKLNKIFVKNITTGLPYVHLKIALTKDGKLTAKKGTRTKITTKKQDIEIHRLRSAYDAILVGRKTVEIDNPRLNCRLKKLTNGKEDGKNPIRIILDTHKKLLKDKKFRNFHIFDGEAETIIASAENKKEKKVDLRKLLKELYERGIYSILVEGGGEVIRSFMYEKLVDEISIYKAGKITPYNKSLDASDYYSVTSRLNL